MNTCTQYTNAVQVKTLVECLYPNKTANDLCGEQTSLFDYPYPWECRINIGHGLELVTLIDLICRCKINTRAVRVDTNTNDSFCICITNFSGERVDYTDKAREEMKNETIVWNTPSYDTCRAGLDNSLINKNLITH